MKNKETEQAIRQYAVVTHDEVEVTSPSPLTGKPAGVKVDEVDDPGAVNAPQIAVESAKSPASTSVPEYKQPLSRLPDQISARQIQADRSNPDGCVASEVQR
jgi:hypothetical protein